MNKITLLAAAAALALMAVPATANNTPSKAMTHHARLMHHARAPSVANANAQAPTGTDAGAQAKAYATDGGGASTPVCKPGSMIKELDGQMHRCQ